MYWPEFVREGARLIFREGRTKGIGRITRIVPLEEEKGPAFPVKIKKKDEEQQQTQLNESQDSIQSEQSEQGSLSNSVSMEGLSHSFSMEKLDKVEKTIETEIKKKT
jgi:hypothetical protein